MGGLWLESLYLFEVNGVLIAINTGCEVTKGYVALPEVSRWSRKWKLLIVCREKQFKTFIKQRAPDIIRGQFISPGNRLQKV